MKKLCEKSVKEKGGDTRGMMCEKTECEQLQERFKTACERLAWEMNRPLFDFKDGDIKKIAEQMVKFR